MHGDPNTVIVREKKTCRVEGCKNTAWAHRLCSKHLTRLKRHGSLEKPGMTFYERFWNKVDENGPIPEHDAGLGCCWEWTASVGNNGYGHFFPAAGTMDLAHRMAYMLVKGDIPEGLQIDHLCRNKRCVNPDHLEPVTPRENTQRYLKARGF